MVRQDAPDFTDVLASVRRQFWRTVFRGLAAR